jgi:hypothetical protein
MCGSRQEHDNEAEYLLCPQAKEGSAVLEAVVGLGHRLTRSWISPAPTEMKEFVEKRFGGGDRKGDVRYLHAKRLPDPHGLYRSASLQLAATSFC